MNEAKQVEECHRVYVTEELVEKGFQRILEGDNSVALAATLERRGGPCPLCGKEFKRLTVDNAYGKFTYYQPDCRCYKVCASVRVPGGTAPGCGRYLIAEREMMIPHCTSCGDYGDNRSAKRTASGYRTARRASGKDEAAGGDA